jgi:hypothetical protein
MSDLGARLTPKERLCLRSICEVSGCSLEALYPEMIRAYLRLIIDAPAALPPLPLVSLVRAAKLSCAPLSAVEGSGNV